MAEGGRHAPTWNKKKKFYLAMLSNDSILYHAGRWCRREKKGWFIMNMIRPWFYVEDERGNQLVEPYFTETPVYGEAEKMARKMSRERGIKTRVNVLFSPHFFVNGRLKKEF